MTHPLRSSPITGPSSLLRGSPPLSGASVLSASRLEPLAPFPLASPARFSRSVPEPGRASRCLHAGCRSVSIRTSSELIPGVGQPPVSTPSNPISTLQKQFACARLSRPYLLGSSSQRFRSAHYRGFCPQQPAVAWDPRPDRRTRRALLHLKYSCAAPFGPAMLVRGRDGRYQPPPAQNRASGIPARGSHLGCLTAKRCCGHG